jgi:hypothetical protein
VWYTGKVLEQPPSAPARSRPVADVTGYAIAAWGVLGFLALLGSAIWRLTPVALEPIRAGMLAWWQAGLYLGWVGFMVYSEGYRGFHLQVAPRVTARSLYLARNPRPLFALLAPLFCMGLIHATRRRLITSWIVLGAIVSLVVMVRQLPQPWRGIVDGGVVLGLALGATSIVWFFARALAGAEVSASPEVPDEPGRV